MLHLVPANRRDVSADDYEVIMATLREAIIAFGDNYRLAKRVGVSRGTIDKIVSGRTKWPRPETMFALLVVLNLRMVLVRR